MLHLPSLSRRLLLTLLATLPLWAPAHSEAAEPKQKTILMRSGWQTVNIGDIGHTPGTLRYLETYLPDVKVILWLHKTTDEVTAMLKTRFPKVEIVQGRLNARGKANNPEFQKAFDEADLFLYNSGMHFNQFWPPPIYIIEACTVTNKPLVLYGQSFDGFAPEDEEKMSQLLSRAAAIYTRDVESFYYLRKIGVTSPSLAFGPDGCFGIDVRDEEQANAWLKAHDLKPKEFITVTLRSNTPKIGAKKSTSMNPANPSKEDLAQNELWTKKLRAVITDWVRKTKKKVLLAPEVNKEIIHAQTMILDKLPEDVKPYVVNRDPFWNVDEAASVYAQAIAVVSMEPHSCIIALAVGTPTMHLASPRHGLKRWMFRDIGLSEWLCNIDEDPADQFTRALLKIDAKPELAQSKVNRAMHTVNTRSKEMMGEIKEILDQQ
ncbi:polysaccharide pyruvyl transferase family protein [Gimesia fumaroli]|uniref:Polysaccharide pyruvyl transferase n=1 Tax=Gimesia fumaroli TaxID=2527976 RepID=A0A518ILG5_9PLAN|nr:polysaccharide pyruvyl transferase family protein [Gimesia fumaroli]QDV53927.1 Polysaccharide pyruvyl transferase [Gimesia fumaroli]